MWTALLAQWHKWAARLEYLRALPDDDPEHATLGPRADASGARFREQFEALAAWAGAGVEEVGELVATAAGKCLAELEREQR